MRTTVRIDDDLLRELKDRAHREDVSLTKLLDRVIRRGLTESNGAGIRKRPYREKTFNMGVPKFDVNKANALAAALEDEEIMATMARIEKLAHGS